MSDRDVVREAVARIRSGPVTTGVIGLGYVGLPLALLCARRLGTVVGLEADPERVEAARACRPYIADVPAAELQEAARAGFRATTDPAELAGCDVIVICVPTPLRKTRDPDLSYIIQSVEAVAAHMRPGKLIVLESTSYPGTTDELVRPYLEKDGLTAGRDFFLAFSPERINPGPAYRKFNLVNTPKVVGGITPACTEVAAAFYGKIVQTVVPVSNSRAAEMVKLIENTYRSVNIALANELAQMCNELGVDVWEVVDAARTKPYGFEAFYPGPGLGGHCIPVDPFYLAWKARLHGIEPRFIDLAGRVNAEMPRHVVRLVTDLLNEAARPVRDSRVHVLGVAYKPDVADTRESPALPIMESLRRKGACLSYTDAHVPSVRLAGGEELRSVPLADADLPGADLVLIVTDHADFPWGEIVSQSRRILDTRNVLKDFREPHIRKL